MSTDIDFDSPPPNYSMGDEVLGPPFTTRSTLPSTTEHSARGVFNSRRNIGSSSGAHKHYSQSSSVPTNKKGVPSNASQERLVEFTTSTIHREHGTKEEYYPVDIVAIHGLTVNHHTTWEADNGKTFQEHEYSPMDTMQKSSTRSEQQIGMHMLVKCYLHSSP